jgi:hypothetical protein
MKSIFALGLTAVAILVLFVFVCSAFWFVFVGRHKQSHRANVFTGFGFGAVFFAIGMYVLCETLFGTISYGVRLLVLFMSMILCLLAMLVATKGTRQTAIPIIAAAGMVALNAIGTMLGH